MLKRMRNYKQKLFVRGRDVKVIIKMTGETPEVRSDKRKPRMFLRHRTS